MVISGVVTRREEAFVLNATLLGGLWRAPRDEEGNGSIYAQHICLFPGL